MLPDRAAVVSAPAAFRWWFLPCWLGLDAPCVALTWTWITARATDNSLEPWVAVALFLVVWSIYLGDRLLDVACCRDWQGATGRLRFGRKWRPMFLAALSCCVIGLLALLRTGLPAAVLRRGALVAVGVGLHYLAFVVPTWSPLRLRGKEFGVGAFFALAAYASLGATWRTLPLLVTVGMLVAFNCLVIAARDRESDRVNDPRAASLWWPTLDRDLRWLGMALTLAAGLVSALAGETAFFLAAAIASALLTGLHWRADCLSGDAVRALADFALLTPLPLVVAARFLEVGGLVSF